MQVYLAINKWFVWLRFCRTWSFSDVVDYTRCLAAANATILDLSCCMTRQCGFLHYLQSMCCPKSGSSKNGYKDTEGSVEYRLVSLPQNIKE